MTYHYVDNNTSGTIQIRLGTAPALSRQDPGDDPIVLDFLANTNLAQTIAHRMNVDHWSVKEPKYAEPTDNLRGVPTA